MQVLNETQLSKLKDDLDEDIIQALNNTKMSDTFLDNFFQSLQSLQEKVKEALIRNNIERALTVDPETEEMTGLKNEILGRKFKTIVNSIESESIETLPVSREAKTWLLNNPAVFRIAEDNIVDEYKKLFAGKLITSGANAKTFIKNLKQYITDKAARKRELIDQLVDIRELTEEQEANIAHIVDNKFKQLFSAFEDIPGESLLIEIEEEVLVVEELAEAPVAELAEGVAVPAEALVAELAEGVAVPAEAPVAEAPQLIPNYVLKQLQEEPNIAYAFFFSAINTAFEAPASTVLPTWEAFQESYANLSEDITTQIAFIDSYSAFFDALKGTISHLRFEASAMLAKALNKVLTDKRKLLNLDDGKKIIIQSMLAQTKLSENKEEKLSILNELGKLALAPPVATSSIAEKAHESNYLIDKTIATHISAVNMSLTAVLIPSAFTETDAKSMSTNIPKSAENIDGYPFLKRYVTESQKIVSIIRDALPTIKLEIQESERLVEINDALKALKREKEAKRTAGLDKTKALYKLNLLTNRPKETEEEITAGALRRAFTNRKIVRPIAVRAKTEVAQAAFLQRVDKALCSISQEETALLCKMTGIKNVTQLVFKKNKTQEADPNILTFDDFITKIKDKKSSRSTKNGSGFRKYLPFTRKPTKILDFALNYVQHHIDKYKVTHNQQPNFAKAREVHLSSFAQQFSQDMTTVSIVPKRNRAMRDLNALLRRKMYKASTLIKEQSSFEDEKKREATVQANVKSKQLISSSLLETTKSTAFFTTQPPSTLIRALFAEHKEAIDLKQELSLLRDAATELGEKIYPGSRLMPSVQKIDEGLKKNANALKEKIVGIKKVLGIKKASGKKPEESLGKLTSDSPVEDYQKFITQVSLAMSYADHLTQFKQNKIQSLTFTDYNEYLKTKANSSHAKLIAACKTINGLHLEMKEGLNEACFQQIDKAKAQRDTLTYEVKRYLTGMKLQLQSQTEFNQLVTDLHLGPAVNFLSEENKTHLNQLIVKYTADLESTVLTDESAKLKCAKFNQAIADITKLLRADGQIQQVIGTYEDTSNLEAKITEETARASKLLSSAKKTVEAITYMADTCTVTFRPSEEKPKPAAATAPAALR